ncbi:MAG: methyltransferase, CheR-type [Polyangiaceae bacterium]|jgi:chemotaxis protein methyltransferase CheR|nr:methyltransferase, CheR-type [Polyangiaceae bacterium]
MNARRELNRLLESQTGIEVTRGGIDASVDTFLARRLKELKLTSVEDYLPRLSAAGGELEVLLNAITVTHTWFMRDPGQLSIVSALFEARSPSASPLRVWVPGCATGEDPYSIAMLAEQAGRSVEVMGSDINSAALRRAAAGVYGSWSVRDIVDVERYFERSERSSFSIAPRLKRHVRFERHNLLEQVLPGEWDVILCRNVLIYLSRERARGVVERLAEALAPGGYLLLGASEVVFEVPQPLEATYLAGRLALRRVSASEKVRISRAEPPSGSLVPRTPAPAWEAPLPALPRAAASIAEPRSAPTGSLGVDSLLTRGHDYLDRSELPEAIIEYELAVEQDATRAEPHMYLGIALYLNGAIEAALHELRAAVFLDAALWPAAFYLAVCHEALGQLVEAQREYRHVVRVASRGGASLLSRRHSAWHDDLLDLARKRAGSAA